MPSVRKAHSHCRQDCQGLLLLLSAAVQCHVRLCLQSQWTICLPPELPLCNPWSTSWLQVNNRRRGLHRKHRLQEEFGEPRGSGKIPAAVQMHDIPLGDKPDDKVNLFIDAHTNSKQGIAAAMHGRV